MEFLMGLLIVLFSVVCAVVGAIVIIRVTIYFLNRNHE